MMKRVKLSGLLLLGTLMVRLSDPEGQPMAQAELYVLEVGTGASQTLQVANGETTLNLVPGDYRIYASKRIERGDFTDRYTTPEARIVVEDASNENLILSARQYDQPDAAADEALLKKIDPTLVLSRR